jgi:SAM-dependent methyltransferase
VSLLDRNLRELEVGFVSKYLRRDHFLADVGCGDGRATRRYAALVDRCIGIERSDHLRGIATEELEAEVIPNLTFVAGDILDLSDYPEAFDVVVTERVLINLPTWEEQQRAIEQIHSTLRPGGLYVMLENTEDGDEALNDLRERVGLTPIPQHWHNRFLEWASFSAWIAPRFELVERRGFSLYYLLTRVYAQLFASFEGFGANAEADPVFAELDPAARRLEEALAGSVTFGDAAVVGPVQGIALRKRSA